MDLNAYLRTVGDRDYGGRSTLWTQLSGALRVQLEQPGAQDDPRHLLLAMDRLGDELHYGYFHVDSASELEGFIDEARTLRKRVGRQLKQLHGEWDGRLEDVASWLFLDSIQLLDEYLDLAGTLAIRPDMSSARHFYYARRLRETLRHLGAGPVRVLEIGAGAGNLAMLLFHYGLVADYTIIDLPEMLLMSGVNLEARAGCGCRFLEYPSGLALERRVHLLSADQDLGPLPDETFGLVLNFNSFSEMPPAVVAAYFTTLYRTARSGAVFMNVNRIQEHHQEDGQVYDMNPLLFPYAPGDRVLVWDVDPFQQFVRQFCRAKAVKSTAILRTAIVRGIPERV